jgi:hypothetical protein
MEDWHMQQTVYGYFSAVEIETGQVGIPTRLGISKMKRWDLGDPKT